MPTSPSTVRSDHRPDTQPSHRSAFAGEEWLLYPDLIDQLRPDPRPDWWTRLRHATAEFLLDPEIDERDHREHATCSVRRYQQELAHRAHHIIVLRVTAGWWHGPALYGYQLRHNVDTDPTGRRGTRYRLILNLHRARVVPVMFARYVHDGLGDDVIAVRLATDPRWYPPPLDPGTGKPCRWTPARVRTILTQPAYLGYVVWGRTRHGHPARSDRWQVSGRATHAALVTPHVFWAAYDRRHPTLDAELDHVLDGDVDGAGVHSGEHHSEQSGHRTSCLGFGEQTGQRR